MTLHDSQWFSNSVDMQWLKYRKHLNKCRHDSSETAVHKFRISARRLLSLIELLQALPPKQDLHKLRKSLRSQLNAFNELRDTQVMLQEVSFMLNTLPALTPFLHHLHINAQNLLIQTPQISKTLDCQKLRQPLKIALHNLEKTTGKADLRQPILSVIDTAFKTAMERFQAIDANQPATLHRLRISIKKLRYMLLSVQALLPTLPNDHLKQIQNYLTSLGEIQNSCVLRANLESFFPNSPPLDIQTHFQQRHNDLIQIYMAKRAKILQFWRADSDIPFPWEA